MIGLWGAGAESAPLGCSSIAHNYLMIETQRSESFSARSPATLQQCRLAVHTLVAELQQDRQMLPAVLCANLPTNQSGKNLNKL